MLLQPDADPPHASDDRLLLKAVSLRPSSLPPTFGATRAEHEHKSLHNASLMNHGVPQGHTMGPTLLNYTRSVQRALCDWGELEGHAHRLGGSQHAVPNRSQKNADK